MELSIGNIGLRVFVLGVLLVLTTGCGPALSDVPGRYVATTPAGSEEIIIVAGGNFDQFVTELSGKTFHQKGTWKISDGKVVLYDMLMCVDMDGKVISPPKSGCVSGFSWHYKYIEVWDEATYHWRYDKK